MLRIKKINFLIPLFLFTLFASFSHQASARENVNNWYIKDFNSTIEILTNDSAIITEDIIADCGTAQGKHGIFRIIPTKANTPDGVIYTPIELISITDFENNPYPYKANADSGTITWQIGSANITVSGENNYRIKYKVKNIIREQVDSDEFYWNLSGNYWDLEIDKFKAEIILPKEIGEMNSEIFLYDGNFNDKNNNFSSYNWTATNILQVESNKILNLNQGITLSLVFPKNYITHQRIEQKDETIGVLPTKDNSPIIYYLATFYLLTTPILVFIISLIFYKRKQKQNPYYKMSIVPEYNPPEGISPIMLGFIDKHTVKSNLITASIVRMAVLKLLIITEKETKIIFIKNKYLEFSKTANQENYEKLDETEKYIFNLLFKSGDIISSEQLKKDFLDKLSVINQKIKMQSRESGYLLKKNHKLKRNYLIAAIILLLTGSFFAFIVLLIFYIISNNLTEKGQKLYWQIQGFKNYMNVAEKERHRFYEKENIFTKLLPYSIAIGNVKEWVQKMEDIYGEEYVKNSFYWYAGIGGLSALNDINNITSNIDSISRNISNSVGSSSGGGGGGFSGGGGGGGGGGGW